jgi:hypothetical protein
MCNTDRCNTKLAWRITVCLNTLLWHNCVQHVHQPMHVQQPWNGGTEDIQPWAPDKSRSRLTSYPVWTEDTWKHLPQSAACNHVCITKSQIPPTMSKQLQCVQHLGIQYPSFQSGSPSPRLTMVVDLPWYHNHSLPQLAHLFQRMWPASQWVTPGSFMWVVN